MGRRPIRPMHRGYLHTHEVASVIGVSTQYIYEEIRLSKRLAAVVVERGASAGRTKGHASIRVYPAQLADYITAYWPEKLAKWQSVKAVWEAAA